jgi:polyisoprenoid-binding protein YceI
MCSTIKLFRYSIFTLLVFTCGAKSASAQQFKADNGYVEFVSTAPLLEFKGVSENLTGLIDLDTKMVDFYVDLNTLETGIRRRDRDMRNSYLETDKYPFAEFTGELISEFDPDLAETQKAKAKGVFKIHGVEREIEVEGTLTPNGNSLLLEAGWVVLLEDYNIDRPRVLFYELAEEQTVNISIELIKTEN